MEKAPGGAAHPKKSEKTFIWAIDDGAEAANLLTPLDAGSELIGVVLVHFGTAN
jgi:hypothetical protein